MKLLFKMFVCVPILVTIVACSNSNTKTNNQEKTDSTSNGDQPVRELKFSMSVGETSPWTQGAFEFAELVEKKSDGKIKVKVYPNGQLANGNQITELELLQNGSIDLTWHSSIILSALDERFIRFQCRG